MAKEKEYVVTVKLRIKAKYDSDALADAHEIMAAAVVGVAGDAALNKRWSSYGIKREAKCLA